MGFDSGRLSHAYITDKSFAKYIAMAVVCSARTGARPCEKCIHCDKASRNIHPDIIIINKEKIKDIDKEAGKAKVNTFVNVDVIRWIKRDLYVIPNDSLQKAYIVEDADTMNGNAQNAFLKMLEEPPKHAVFILCTDNPSALFETIRSRCVELKPQPGIKSDAKPGIKSDAKPGINQSSDPDTGTTATDFENEDLKDLIDDFLKALSGDLMILMECMFRLEKLDRPAFSDFLIKAREKAIKILRDDIDNKSLPVRKKLANAESILLKAGEMFDLNVSTGHIAGFICASMIDDRNEDIF